MYPQLTLSASSLHRIDAQYRTPRLPVWRPNWSSRVQLQIHRFFWTYSISDVWLTIRDPIAGFRSLSTQHKECWSTVLVPLIVVPISLFECLSDGRVEVVEGLGEGSRDDSVEVDLMGYFGHLELQFLSRTSISVHFEPKTKENWWKFWKLQIFETFRKYPQNQIAVTQQVLVQVPQNTHL